VGPDSISVPPYHSISPLNRNCFSKPIPSLDSAYGACEKCGFTPEHCRAIQFGRLSYTDLSFINKVDFYENTPLHSAAAAVKQDEFWKIKYMIDRGADVKICNSSGETFLHFLCQKGPMGMKDIGDFLEILRSLSRLNFPFSKRDYHGRTILHNLVRFMKEWKVTYGISILFDFFSLLKPELMAMDNAANELLEALYERGKNEKIKNFKKYKKELNSLTTKFNAASSYPPRYQSTLVGKTRQQMYIWMAEIQATQGFTWIDTEGDTVLTALLKSGRSPTTNLDDDFFRSIVESMIEDGADIHMRDRNGNTALALAAKSGFRLVVLLLLEKGANFHSRDYRGTGILSQLERSMSLAADSMHLWASI